VSDLNALDVLIRLLVALVLGGVIGFERERQERAAGLRTVTMVSLGSCLFTLLSIGAFHGTTNTDPSRVAAQVVTGIGFLCAGTIFLRKDLVRGLTTAATIWATAAIGMAAATAEFFAASFTTLLILVVLMVLKPIERRLFKRPQEARVSLLMPRRDGGIEAVRTALATLGAVPQSIEFQEVGPAEDRMEFELDVPPSCTTADLLRQLRAVEGVHQITVFREAEDRSRIGT
jgi:putative Mg2+ transporter-C (MgtC) family protein